MWVCTALYAGTVHGRCVMYARGRGEWLRLLEVLEVPEVMYCVLLCMLEAVEGRLSLPGGVGGVGGAGGDVLCAALYAGGDALCAALSDMPETLSLWQVSRYSPRPGPLHAPPRVKSRLALWPAGSSGLDSFPTQQAGQLASRSGRWVKSVWLVDGVGSGLTNSQPAKRHRSGLHLSHMLGLRCACSHSVESSTDAKINLPK
jgi:hypothetical protein